MKITNNVTLKTAIGINGNHGIGNGAFLAVRGGSTRFVFRSGAKGKEVPIGKFPEMSLAEARTKAGGLRHAYRIEKIDPRVAVKAKPATVPTFRDDTLTYYEFKRRTWDADHARIWKQSMENHVWPHIGERDTATLTITDVADVLKPIWETMHETAIRIHGRIRAVIEHAMDTDDVDRFKNGNPANRALKRLPQGVEQAEVPHPAPTWQEVPALYARLCATPGLPALALRFLLLCCCPRAAEVIGAKWSEIDGDVFHVPACRMKSGKARDIPLSGAALALLADLPGEREGFIFPGRAGKTVDGQFIAFSGAMHHDAMQILLRDELQTLWHVHGLRSSFRTWVSDHAKTVRDHDAGELCLDHTIGSKVHRAYDRADMMVERRDLAERFSVHLIG